MAFKRKRVYSIKDDKKTRRHKKKTPSLKRNRSKSVTERKRKRRRKQSDTSSSDDSSSSSSSSSSDSTSASESDSVSDSGDSERDSGFSSYDSDDFDGLTGSHMPREPHPAFANLPQLDFTTLPDNFFALFYGCRRTGKTHGSTQLLEPIANRFDFAYLFSSTAALHKNEKGFANFDMIRDEAKFDGFDEEKLIAIIERSKAVKAFNNDCKYKRDMKPNKVLLIFDDFVHEAGVRYSKVFTSLPVLGRHYDISVICLSQGYSAVGSSGLNPATRMNADIVMTFLPRNILDIERIAQWYMGKGKNESMWFVKTATEEKHRLLAMDLTDPSKVEFKDFCSTYKGPEELPKYEIGKVQWKLFHEERKRQKALEIERQMETNVPQFMSMNYDTTKSTGRVNNERTRRTMFDAFR